MLLLLVHLSVLGCSKFLVIHQDKSHQMTDFIYLPTSRRPVVLAHSEDTMKRTTDLDLYTEMCFIIIPCGWDVFIIWPGLIYTPDFTFQMHGYIILCFAWINIFVFINCCSYLCELPVWNSYILHQVYFWVFNLQVTVYNLKL